MATLGDLPVFAFLLLPAALCALIGMLLLRRRRRTLGRSRRGPMRMLLAFCFLLLAVGFGLLAVSIHNFFRFDGEAAVATLAVRQQGPQRFEVDLLAEDRAPQTYTLRGDQWQLDARVIRWRLPALLAGAPPLYRLERISGRYLDIGQEREAERAVYALDEDAFPDLWSLKREYPQWLPFVDAQYGSAAYLPLIDGARFEVTVDARGGLVARPADTATAAQLEQAGW